MKKKSKKRLIKLLKAKTKEVKLLRDQSKARPCQHKNVTHYNHGYHNKGNRLYRHILSETFIFG